MICWIAALAQSPITRDSNLDFKPFTVTTHNRPISFNVINNGIVWYTPCLKKTVQICICQNFAKFPPISTSIFRRRALVRFLQREAELHLLHSCIHTLSYANLYNVSCCQLNFDIHVAYTTLALGASYGTRPDYHASWSIFSSFFLYIFCLSRVAWTTRQLFTVR